MATPAGSDGVAFATDRVAGTLQPQHSQLPGVCFDVASPVHVKRHGVV